MTVEGISFNSQWILKKFQTAEQFAGHYSKRSVWPGKPAERQREMLEFVFNLVKHENSSRNAGAGSGN